VTAIGQSPEAPEGEWTSRLLSGKVCRAARRCADPNASGGAGQHISSAPIVQSPVLPGALLARARDLDAAHRVRTGKPISRATLRGQLRIGRDRTSALIAAIRAEAAASDQANPGPLRAAWDLS
jgi:hypothetical protein